MAFFGITTLGPQNSLGSNLMQSGLLNCFEPHEFAACYHRVAARSEAPVKKGDVPAMLELLYKGPAPDCDVARVRAALGGAASDVMALDAFAGAVEAAKLEETAWEKAQVYKVGDASEFASSKFYREHITRHERSDAARSFQSPPETAARRGGGPVFVVHFETAGMDLGPNEKYKQPVTATMELGWRPPDADEATLTRAGKKSCPETIYAAELYKAGVYY